jgi:hypothetical protein
MKCVPECVLPFQVVISRRTRGGGQGRVGEGRGCVSFGGNSRADLLDAMAGHGIIGIDRQDRGEAEERIARAGGRTGPPQPGLLVVRVGLGRGVEVIIRRRLVVFLGGHNAPFDGLGGFHH